jgi:hypothetical protein
VNDYLGGQSRQELEALLRRLVTQGTEGPKVDFKKALNLKEKSALAELAKDLSSIANTDDEGRLDDFGYIILGAEIGTLVGGVAELAGDTDKLQAQVTDVIKAYVCPVPQFSICAFDDATLGRWGAIVIAPSARQPHIFVRDGAGDVVKHEWWVRVNDTKDRAGPHDYARFLAKAVRREVRPLELEVQRLALKIDQRSAPDMVALVEALRATPNGSEGKEAATTDLGSTVRRLLLRGNAAVEDALVAEALRVAETMAETSDRNPWDLSRATPAQLRDALSYMEERTFPLAEALATAARYDSEGVLIDAVCRSLTVIANEPQPLGAHSRYIAQFRLYPLVLCLYAVTAVAANERRGALLKAVFSVSLRREGRDRVDPVIVSFRSIKASLEVFAKALEKCYVEPIAVRVREVLMPRLSGLLVGTSSKDAFFVAEFVLGLAFLTVSSGMHHGKIPLPGIYLYESEAQRPLKIFLKQRPDWLEELLGEPLYAVLPEFDRTASTVVSQGGWPDGFVSGAMEAYRPAVK